MDYSLTIRVLVGPKGKEFTVPECLLTSTSAFFRAACSEKWKEGQERLVRLPEHDVDSWNEYLHCKFTQSVAKPDVSKNTCGEETDPWIRIVQLWITADQLQDVHLQNKVVDEMLSMNTRRSDYAGPKTVSLAREHTTPDAPLRRLLIDEYLASNIGIDYMREHWSKYPSDFLRDLFAAALGAKRNPKAKQYIAPRLRHRCHYHIHNSDCPKCEDVVKIVEESEESEEDSEESG